MVIQRWQSLYLLIASLFIGLFCYMPMASLVDNSKLSMCQFPIYLTLNVLIGILLLISIFFILGFVYTLKITKKPSFIKENIFSFIKSVKLIPNFS